MGLRVTTELRMDTSSTKDDRAINVIIPAYNEEVGISSVIRELNQVAHQNDLTLEVLVVDDGSTDATATLAVQAGARLIQHPNRRGYGAALNTGVFAARTDIIVILDADGTYPASTLPELVSALNDAAMTVACRARFGPNCNRLRSLVKLPLTWLSNYITGVRIPDLNSGMRAFRRASILPYLGILPSTFSWTTTITLSLLCDGLPVLYIPAEYHARLGTSKFSIQHAALLPLLLLRIALLFRPLKVFMPLAGISLLFGGTEGVLDVAHNRDVSAFGLFALAMCALLVVTGVIADLNSSFITNMSRYWAARTWSHTHADTPGIPMGRSVSQVHVERAML